MADSLSDDPTSVSRPSSPPPSAAAQSATGSPIVDYIMEAAGREGERHETPDKCKSPTQVIKEWTPFCEEELKPKTGLEFANLEEYCMQAAGKDVEKLTLINQRIRDASKEVKELYGNTSASKMSGLESFIGSSAPDQIDILPPKQCNTKGSDKRIKGGKEKAMEQQGKRLRLCKACGEQAYHDSCNCPTKLSS